MGGTRSSAPTGRARPVEIVIVVAMALVVLASGSPGVAGAIPAAVVTPAMVGHPASRAGAAPGPDGSGIRDWVNLSANETHPPPATAFGVSVWDPALGGILLFGGFSPGGPPTNTTWLFQNGSWSELHPPRSPPAMEGASMVYDPAGGYALLFGGTAPASPYYSNATWIFQNSNWTKLTTAVSPPARLGASMAYDSSSGEVVLFGGAASSNPLSDTWTFAGGNWRNATVTGPSGRIHAAMVDDPADGGVLLIGGLTSSGSVGATWTYARGNWTRPSLSTYPMGTGIPQAVVDPLTGGIFLLVGASFASLISDSWEFDNGSWTNLTSTLVAEPPGTVGGILAAFPPTGAIIGFGGQLNNPLLPHIPVDYTWALRVPISVEAPTATPPSGLVDQGQSANFSVMMTGGLGGTVYRWTGLPQGCTRFDQPRPECLLAGNGTFLVEVTVADIYAASASPQLIYTVAPEPRAGAPVPSRPSADVGQTVEFSDTASGGSGPLWLRWSGLPTTCPSSGLAVTCTFSLPGTLQIRATVTDAAGVTAGGPSLSFPVLTDPVIGAPVLATGSADTAVADVGMTAVLTAKLTVPGAGSPYTYLWAGLPAGCAGANEATVSCPLTTPGLESVTVGVTDANGFAVTSAPVTWSTNPAMNLSVETVGPSPTVGASATLFAEVAGGSAPFAINWSFPGGGSAAGLFADHTFPAAGAQTVEVHVVDAAGRTADSNVTVTVAATPSTSPAASAPPVSSAALGIAIAALLLAVVGILLPILRRPRRHGAHPPAPRTDGTAGAGTDGAAPRIEGAEGRTPR